MNDFKSRLDSLRNNTNFVHEFGQKATSWGITTIPEANETCHIKQLRVSLVPRAFSRTLFQKVVDLNPVFNKLMDAICDDVEWLEFAHIDVVNCDDFVRRLICLMKDVYGTPSGGKAKDIHEDVRLHLFRNDFLPTDGDKRILQVEINSISAGFAGIIESLSCIHFSNRMQYYPWLNGELPLNNPSSSFAGAMAKALHLNNLKWGRTASAVLFVIESDEKNVVDQYAIERCLTLKHRITVIRRTLAQITQNGGIDSNGLLVVEGIEIALVYFRSGYGPEHYPSEMEWSARSLIETSRCVKVPSVLAQLAGTKKVQQLWYDKNGSSLKRFGVSDSDAVQLSQVFATQVDPSQDQDMRQKAIQNPETWVLKPQREGGGHNLYDMQLKAALTSLSKDQLSQYVLMERMTPEPLPALVVDGQATQEQRKIVPAIIDEAVSELGIFSYYLPSLGENCVCGHMLRTKEKNVREGGVNAGFSVLDTVHLV